MRIGGLASGIDTESMIKDLMNAERIPLDKMHQDRTKLEWKRDAFRDVNKLLGNFDQNMILNMKLSETFNKKLFPRHRRMRFVLRGMLVRIVVRIGLMWSS